MRIHRQSRRMLGGNCNANMERPVSQKHLIASEKHKPMPILGGRFVRAQQNWTTYKKEAYSFVQTSDRMDYISLRPQPVYTVTDRRSLFYVFASLSLWPSSPRHLLSKLQKWAIHSSRFEFFINHIAGASNVLADILTSCSKGYRAASSQRSAE